MLLFNSLEFRLDHYFLLKRATMHEYGVYEAKTKLAELIKQVQRGEQVTITNRGEPVVDLVPSASRIAQQTVDAIKAIKAMRVGNINQKEFDEMRLKGRR